MTSRTNILIGSRGSNLALWQAHHMKNELEQRFPSLSIELKIIKTTGDKVLDSPLSKIGDKGLFTREIEHALLEHRIDLAIHSLKDLPTKLPDGLTIGAVTKREEVNDVFISHYKKNHKHIDNLPQGAVIATGSLRRKCQLLNWRRDLTIVDLRGNLETRIAKLDASDWDGIVLAKAGLQRLRLNERITEVLPTKKILPAVGQGALAVEIREEDIQMKQYLHSISHEPTTIATRAERTLLKYLEGGCQAPIGAYGRIENNELFLDALIGSLDGKRIVRGKIHAPSEEAEGTGERLAEILLKSGGKEILEQIRGKNPEEIPAV